MENRIQEQYSVIATRITKINLSLRAIGLYAYMTSKPRDWAFSYAGIKSQVKEGEKAIRGAVKELEAAELLIKIPRRSNGGEMAGWEWILNPNESDKNRVLSHHRHSPYGHDGLGHDQKGHDIVIIEEVNIIKDIKKKSIKKEIEPKQKSGEYKNVLLTRAEKLKLINEFGAEEAKERVDRLSEWIESKGAKYKSHYATIKAWARRDAQRADKARETKKTTNDTYKTKTSQKQATRRQEREHHSTDEDVLAKLMGAVV